MNRETQIRELVDVMPHPTVVRLDDLDGEDSGWITDAYAITGDVERHLRVLRHALGKRRGCGAFLIGQYGSGKSHFLAYVVEELRGGRLLAGSTTAEEPRSEARELAGSPEPIALSLLNYRGDTPLEDVVHGALGLGKVHGDRRVAWDAIEEQYPNGALLVLDELSEFLRSKPDTRSFNEDIRYLQYLGEWAQGHPFWVLAAMQESIEHTGDLEHGLYRKIKDRYPLRMLLSPGHVRDLLAEAILIKRPGYEPAARSLAAELKQAFPDAPFDIEELATIYPLHPATLELLEEVRDRFSQARGIVDFAVTRLRGNPSRGVEPFLDRPWGSLLGPDEIIVHFRDLLDLQEEFQPLAQQVFPYFERHLAKTAPTKALRDLASRVVNLLVLVELSPAREAITAREAAYWLLYRATRLDPDKNLSVITRVLDSLAEKGRYVAAKNGRYRLNLADDGGAALERFLSRQRTEVRERGEGVFDLIAPLLAGNGFHPFGLPRDTWQSRVVRWHFHERKCDVFFGNAEPPRKNGIALCLRLPWGRPRPTLAAATIQPAPLEVGEEHFELAALAEARKRPWSASARHRLEARLRQQLELFASQLRNSLLESTLSLPNGVEEEIPRSSASTFDQWLDRVALRVLQRTYPQFERFAPACGPLPKVAYQRWLEFVLAHDLTEPTSDEYVSTVREAYLVPMGLLKRKGREYSLPANLEKQDLVRLVLPLLDSQPAPASLYEHLAQPVYGLVPDQVSLLLSFLFAVGEIDLLKGKRSLRECHEILPHPIQYDRVVAGRGLAPEPLRQLEEVLGGLGRKRPKQWTVLAERRAAEALAEEAGSRRLGIEGLLLQLRNLEESDGGLSGRLERALGQWRALEEGEDPLRGLERFLFEIAPAERFVAEAIALEKLPERFEKLVGERERLRHLLAHPLVRECPEHEVPARLEALGPPPPLDRLEAIDGWIEKAREVHRDYSSWYRARHEAWWRECSKGGARQWRPPAVAASRHLQLQDDLEALRAARDRASTKVCRGLVNLDFQPICHCGFDGKGSPIAEELQRMGELRKEVEQQVERFFARQDVRSRLRKWVSDGLEVTPGFRAYLDGSAPCPDVPDLERFDRHLAGIDLVKEIDARPLFELLRERTWEREELLERIDQELARHGDTRLRFTPMGAAGPDGVLAWCIEQSLRFGVELPRGLAASAGAFDTELLRPEWVRPAALERLEELGLGEGIVETVLGWLVGGRIALEVGSATSALVAAARETTRPRAVESPAELAELAANLYAHHDTLLRVAAERWLGRLDALAHAELREGAPPLVDALRDRRDVQWVVIDGLGAPLATRLRSPLAAALAEWEERGLAWALVSAETSTDAWYAELAEAGLNVPVEKINGVDDLLHARFLPLGDFARLAATEVEVALGRIARRLDRTRPVVLFADHGFRIARDGRSYAHGGNSTLERLVPLLDFAPRA